MGYHDTQDEYKNRDYRMISYFAPYKTWETYKTGDLVLISSSIEGGGYINRKWRSWKYGVYRGVQTESYDFPQICLAEVYLIYAETLWLMNGALTDAELDQSINKTKARAGLPPLTNAFAAANNLNIYDEILRERAVELYIDGGRLDDLKRWGIAEETLNVTTYGIVIEGTVYENNPALYLPGGWPYGEESTQTAVGMRRCLVRGTITDKEFALRNYLSGIPTGEIALNKKLLQNPGY